MTIPIRLFLHIGRHKTGTKALQDHCRKSASAIKRRSIIYPETGCQWRNGRLSTGQHEIAVQCHPELHQPGKFAALKSAFEAEIADYRSVILSSEGFQNLQDFELFDHFFNHPAGYDITIVCYLREYLSYLVSSYRQLTQNRTRFICFSDYCRRDLDVESFLHRWSRFNRLILRPYDRYRLRNGNIIDDFCDLAGLDCPSRTESNFNPSIGGNLLFFRLVENRFGLLPIPYRKAEQLAIDHAPFRRCFRISDETADAIRSSSSYNTIVFDRVGQMAAPSFAECPAVPIAETIEDDLRRVYDEPRRDEMREAAARASGEARDWLRF